MVFRLDKGTGYMYSYQPEHPCANSAGKVMEHVYVVWKHTGKIPSKHECIHHKDRNKTNNDISNLMLMTQSDHARLHQFEDKGGKPPSVLVCNHCNKEFTTIYHDSRFCSQECVTLSNRKFDITKERLEELVWSMSTVKVAELLGVSDVAVAKRCKRLGVEKPPRGYWAKFKQHQTSLTT